MIVAIEAKIRHQVRKRLGVWEVLIRKYSE